MAPRNQRHHRLLVEPLEERTLLNATPTLAMGQTAFAVVKTSTLNIQISATDKDKGQVLNFSLVGAPGGATISTVQVPSTTESTAVGTFSWTPNEDQGPASYTFSVMVTDNGKPVRSATKSITVSTLAVGLVGNDLWIVGTSTNKGTAANPGNDSATVSSTNFSNTVSVSINGATGNFTLPAGGRIETKLFDGNDQFSINEGTGTSNIGPATSVNGGNGADAVTVNGTQNPDAFTITDTAVDLTGAGIINYSNAETLLVNGLGGNDTFAMTAINPQTVTTLDGGADLDSYSGSFAADFAGTLTLSNMETSTMSVPGAVIAGSAITGTDFFDVTIGELRGTLWANAGSITNANFGKITPTGLLKASETSELTAGVLRHLIVDIDEGIIHAGSIQHANFGFVAAGATITVQGAGTADDVTIGTLEGSFIALEDSDPNSGFMRNIIIDEILGLGDVFSGAISGMTVGTIDEGGSIVVAGHGTADDVTIGTLEGSFIALEDSDPNSGFMRNIIIDEILGLGDVFSGAISGMTVGTVDEGASIAVAGHGTINNLTIDFLAGIVTAERDDSPGSGFVTNTTIGVLQNSGIIRAFAANTLTVTTVSGTIDVTDTLTNFAAGTLVETANLIAGKFLVVTAEHVAPIVHFVEPTVTRTIAATPHIPGGGIPDFSLYYDGTGSGNPIAVVRFDAATTGNFDFAVTSDAANIGGAGIDLAGIYSATNNPIGIHNLVVGGSLLLGAVPAGAIAFLDLEPGTSGGVQLPQEILAVGVAGALPASSILATSVPSLAANSFAGVAANVAGNPDAKRTLAGVTTLSQANDTFKLIFSEAGSVQQFLVTGNGSSFDNKSLLFSDILADNVPIHAEVNVVANGSSSSVVSVAFVGQGASLETSQPILSQISALGGSIGNLILSAPQGLANVTADSIIGNIDVSNGAIHGIIQTTVGDLGRSFTDSAGNIVGVTELRTGGGGLTGKILVKGNLISQVDLQSGLDGVVATDGDIGIIQTVGGQAKLNPDGSLIRFGGITVATGGVNGQVIALGNVYGDLKVTGGLSGRIAVKGNSGAFGLDSFRFGILGNVSISGGISKSGGIFSSGLIGDDGNNRINNDLNGTQLSVSGSHQGIIAAGNDINFAGSTLTNGVFEDASGSNLEAIDAIFTHDGNLLDVLDPTELEHIIDDLLILRVSGRRLIGTTS